MVRKAVDKLLSLIEVSDALKSSDDVCSTIKVLAKYRWVASEIERYWLKPLNIESESWIKHKDINTVMLVTSLMPDEFLGTY